MRTAPADRPASLPCSSRRGPGPARRSSLGALLLVAACGTEAATELPRADAGLANLEGGAQTDASLGPTSTVGDAAFSPGADAARIDAGAGAPTGVGAGCMLGEAGSFATDESLDLFGETVYFAMGQELPAGRYRIGYRDGCMKYNNIFPWTVNSNGGSDGWWLVGESPDDRLFVLPGAAAAHPLDGHLDFDACVQASRALEPVEFDFEGGRLGIWLNDAPYQDNQAGQGGRNPAWDLTLLVEECPPDLVLI